MSCETVTQCLSAGQPLTPSARQHLETCQACRLMTDSLESPGELPSAAQIESLQGVLTNRLKPVRPLPSDGAMTLISLLVFSLFSMLATIPVGFEGFRRLTAGQELPYYGLILVCALLFSVAIVQNIIPGAKRRIAPGLLIPLSTLSVAALATFLFPSSGMAHFVQSGIPCLRLGCVSAAAGGALAYFLIRKGYPIRPLMAGVIACFFAGLAGVAVLALHCPIQNSLHIVVWHVGALVLSGIAGTGVCRLWLRAKDRREAP